VVRVVWGVFQGWLLSLTWSILAKLPKSEMGVLCMAASTPLLYMHPYHVANVYGKGAGQCRPEPVAWSVYVALCGSLASAKVRWSAQDLRYPHHQTGSTNPGEPPHTNTYMH
jgi:hypothetical protein